MDEPDDRHGAYRVGLEPEAPQAQSEQISVYIDRERGWRARQPGEKVTSAALAAQGLTSLAARQQMPRPRPRSTRARAGRGSGGRRADHSSGPRGHVLRVLDAARVVREYDDPDSRLS